MRTVSVPEDHTEGGRCWPCTLANASVGLVVAWLPLVAAVLEGAEAVVLATTVWGVGVTGFTLYRLVDRGYLPLAEPVAKVTGLHDRIGPGSGSGGEEKR